MNETGPRIGIVGSAGTGKSMLGMCFEARTGVEFIAAKNITTDILVRDGYDYTAQIQVERFLAHGHRQHEIMERTRSAQDGVDAFITDRTFVDLAAYALREMHESDPKEMRAILDTCRDEVGRYTHLFLCPWAGVDLRRSNQKRTLNPYYQLLIHMIEVGLLEDWGVDYYEFGSKCVDDRVCEVVEVLRRGGVEVPFIDEVGVGDVIEGEGDEQD